MLWKYQKHPNTTAIPNIMPRKNTNQRDFMSHSQGRAIPLPPGSFP